MNADFQNFKHKALTDQIIKIFYKVYGTLGYGFLEKVYESEKMIKFRIEGVPAISQSPIEVLYNNELIGKYYADIFVDNKVIVEIKATRTLASEHEAQLLNYLKATDVEVGLLLNYGPKPEIKRKVFDNLRK
jgi:GxxExxY protein